MYGSSSKDDGSTYLYIRGAKSRGYESDVFMQQQFSGGRACSFIHYLFLLYGDLELNTHIYVR